MNTTQPPSPYVAGPRAAQIMIVAAFTVVTGLAFAAVLTGQAIAAVGLVSTALMPLVWWVLDPGARRRVVEAGLEVARSIGRRWGPGP